MSHNLSDATPPTTPSALKCLANMAIVGSVGMLYKIRVEACVVGTKRR